MSLASKGPTIDRVFLGSLRSRYADQRANYVCIVTSEYQSRYLAAPTVLPDDFRPQLDMRLLRRRKVAPCMLRPIQPCQRDTEVNPLSVSKSNRNNPAPSNSNASSDGNLAEMFPRYAGGSTRRSLFPRG